MSSPLIARDPHLARLRDNGYDLEVRGAHLLIHSIPYVNAKKEVRTDGVLVMVLAGETSSVPPDHTAYFIGEHPCTVNGIEIAIKNNSKRQVLAPGLEVDHYFSAKPATPYPDHHEKVTRYVEIISGPARALRPEVSAQTYKPIRASEEESVFRYMDTASTRAGIAVPTARLKGQKIAIVGLGGTGAYVLDFVAKAPVAEIHLFDGDVVLQHNAFRFPGAMSFEELEAKPKKVLHLAAQYDVMRRAIVPHTEMITENNVAVLRGFDHVFLCVDTGKARRLVVNELRGTAASVYDVGMGVHLTEDTQQVFGICRVTALCGERHSHAERWIPMTDAEDAGVYRNNSQIAELNAVNAALAVALWKKRSGFYVDHGGELHLTYTLGTNLLAGSEGAP